MSVSCGQKQHHFRTIKQSEFIFEIFWVTMFGSPTENIPTIETTFQNHNRSDRNNGESFENQTIGPTFFEKR